MTILVAILTIGILVILHELGHLFAAKKFGVKVEEFGIGLPPRLFGKQYGETIYSFNALPIGGFVRMEGEEKRSDSPTSFHRKPPWQRFVIVAAGVMVFWFVAVVIFAGVGGTSGLPMAIDDQDEGVRNPQVRVIGVAVDSPASKAAIKVGDTILRMSEKEISKVKEVQELSQIYAGKEIFLQIQRGERIFDIRLTPREIPPPGEGPVGIVLTRTGLVRYPWYEAPGQGVVRTWQITKSIVTIFGTMLSGLLKGEGLPPGTQMTGPVGVVDLLKNSLGLGVPTFLSFVGVLSVYLAIFNTLPIPALDGGRMLFIVLEGIRRKPVPETIERGLIVLSFLLLIPLLFWVTVGDVKRLL